MRILTFLIGVVGLAGIAWLFWIITYPLARRLGIFKKDESK